METELVQNVAVDPLLKAAPEKESYSSNKQEFDYVANGQIMVTITLGEYRALVKQNADNLVSDANSKMYGLRTERDELKKQVAELQKQLNDLRGMIASAVPVKVTVDQPDA